MLNKKLEKFIAKRVLIFWIVLAVLDILFLDRPWIVFAGLTVGSAFGLVRLGSMTALFYRLLPEGEKDKVVRKSVFRYIFNQIIIFTVLAVSLIFDLWFFFGMAAGVLLVPLVILVNAVTEAVGWTRNGFE